MKKLLILIAITVCSSSVYGQGGAANLRHGTLAERPATCLASRGEVYFQTDGIAGVYDCPVNNAWRFVGGGKSTQGLASARPAASNSNASQFYFATDTNGGTLYVSTGSAWVKVGLGLTETPPTHVHTIPEISSLQAALDAKAALSHTHTLSQVTDAGSAASKNTPATGNAAVGEVVLGSDTRLSDSRTPSGSAGGVLSGSYPNPGFAVDMAEQSELNSHTANTSNPHSVTAAQVGAYTTAVADTLFAAKQDALGFTPENSGNKNATNGYAGLSGGLLTRSQLPVFVGSGASHAIGAVPDPGAGAGTTKYLREDATWVTPPSGITNSASANVIPKSNGTNLVASRITDDGSTIQIASTNNATVLSNTNATHGVSGSNSTRTFELRASWNTTGTPTLIYGEVSSLASGANSKFLDFNDGFVSKFSVKKNGDVTTAGQVTAGGFTGAGFFSTGVYSFASGTTLRADSANGQLEVLDDSENPGDLITKGILSQGVEVQLGDRNGDGNGTKINIDDSASSISIQATEKISLSTGPIIGDPGTRPTCNLSQRGRIWNDFGAGGVKDSSAICLKDASDVYAWRVIY